MHNVKQSSTNSNDQLLPFTEPGLVHSASKDVQDTSADVYRELLASGSIDQRKRLILESLHAYLTYKIGAPTTRELHLWMHERGLVDADPNSIKPRISEAKNEKLIEYSSKRRCSITGKRVNTIVLTQRGELLLEHLERERCKKN